MTSTKVLFILLVSLTLFPLVSAQIIFKDYPQGVYNWGDILEVNFSIKKQESFSGFMDVKLICGSKSFLLYRVPVSLNSNQKKYFSFFWEEKNLVGSNCRISVLLDEIEEKSDYFRISNQIDVEAEINKFSFNPSEFLFLEGEAKKKNGDLVDGFAKISFMGSYHQIEVQDGSFYHEFQLDPNSPPSEYLVKIEVFEGDSLDESLNSGFFQIPFEVFPILRNISIFSEDIFSPGETVKFDFSLRDQENQPLPEENLMTYKILNPNKDLVSEGTINSNHSLFYTFNLDDLDGYWTIEVSLGLISNRGRIQLRGVPYLDIDFNDDTFEISNKGNSFFGGILEFSFINSLTEEEIIQIVNLNLDENEVYSFSPELKIGNYYEVFIKGDRWGNGTYWDKVEIKEKTSSWVTAAVIGLGNLKFNWIFIIILSIILLAGLFFSFRKKIFKHFSKFFIKKEISESKKENLTPLVSPLKDEKVFLIFFKCNPTFSKKLKEILSNENLSLKEISEGFFFSLLRYTKISQPEINLLKLTKRVLSFSRKKREVVEAMVHLSGKEENLKQFLISSEKIFEKRLGEFIITEEIYKKLPEDKKRFFIEVKSFAIGENIIKIYSYKGI
ncbi:hypothetical protein K0A97_03465 [Patescibacteria group bacterium]|nr:hypothetical protein [Patescibacteria group bacterium]